MWKGHSVCSEALSARVSGPSSSRPSPPGTRTRRPGQRLQAQGLVHKQAAGQPATVNEFIAHIGHILDRSIRVTIDQSRFRTADKQVQKANIALLERTTGWRPERTLQDGLAALLRFEGFL